MSKSYPSRFTAYIRNEITGTIIPINVTPEGLSENTSASYSQQDIVGASTPRIIYTSTSATKLSFSLKNLSEDYMPEGYNLDSYIRALKALTYPEYSNGGIVTPPKCTVKLGTLVYRCVCDNVSISYQPLIHTRYNSNTGTYDDNRFKYADIDLSFIRIRDNIPGATYIESKG